MIASCAARRLRERKLAADDRIQRAAREAADDRGVDLDEIAVGHVEQRHAENGRVAAHRVARVDFDAPAVADDDDAAEPGEHAEIAIEVDVREHFEDHVRPATVRRVHDLVRCTSSAR